MEFCTKQFNTVFYVILLYLYNFLNACQRCPHNAFFSLRPQSPQHYCDNTFPQRITQCCTKRHASQYLCQNHPVYCTGIHNDVLNSTVEHT